MVSNAIVIISYTGHYGWSSIINCYQSIRNLDNNITIIIVNNYIEELPTSLRNDNNLRYIPQANQFELGSIKTALNNNPDIDNFYIVHDSCLFQHSIPEYKEDTIFWKTTIFDISPVMSIIQQWCTEYFPDIIFNDPNSIMCQGLMGYFSRDTLHKAMEYGLKNIQITYKSEAVASEGMFGIILRKINPSISSYYPYKLDTYITGKAPYGSIIKLAGGKNGGTKTNMFHLSIPKGHYAHPSHSFSFEYCHTIYPSLEECVRLQGDHKDTAVMEYYKANKSALEYLTQPHISEYYLEDDNLQICNVLQRNKHYLYTLRYFNIYQYTSS
jgi:hypothetical protein